MKSEEQIKIALFGVLEGAYHLGAMPRHMYVGMTLAIATLAWVLDAEVKALENNDSEEAKESEKLAADWIAALDRQMDIGATKPES
jgi:hypothetical protein